METLKCIKTRRSERGFTGEEIYMSEADDIILSATNIPHAGGINDSLIYLLLGKEVQEIMPYVNGQEWIAKSGLIAIVASIPSLIENKYGDVGEFYSIQQSGAISQNILLAAHDLGFGACWVGAIDKQAIKDLVLEKDDTIEDKSFVVRNIIAIGHLWNSK